jgi:hypothetical protein
VAEVALKKAKMAFQCVVSRLIRWLYWQQYDTARDGVGVGPLLALAFLSDDSSHAQRISGQKQRGGQGL